VITLPRDLLKWYGWQPFRAWDQVVRPPHRAWPRYRTATDGCDLVVVEGGLTVVANQASVSVSVLTLYNRPDLGVAGGSPILQWRPVP
jgi:hypothetical protein